MDSFTIDDTNINTSAPRKSKSSRIFLKLPFRIQPKLHWAAIKLYGATHNQSIANKRQSDDHTTTNDILEMAWDNDVSQQNHQSSSDIEQETCLIQQNQMKQSTRDINSNDVVVPSLFDTCSSQPQSDNEFESISWTTSLTTLFAWVALIVFAHFRNFLQKIGIEKNRAATEIDKQKDFVPLFSDFESLYTRHCYMRVRDVFERPIASTPGAIVKLVDRVTNDYCWTFQYTGTYTDVINVGSYNYLGFAENTGPCANAAVNAIDQYGLSTCTTVHEQGKSLPQHHLEKLVAKFLGVDDALCFAMGFATNSMNAPCLVDKHSLIISDELNHASLILGCRLSGAQINVFKHNDMVDLERLLRRAIVNHTHRPYRKILIIVEGVYSMEGSICNLPAIIALKNKYKAYLYLDEAHSIGALGHTGRGVVEYWGCDVHDVDIMMGTFTKSFGAAGGYIAGRQCIIDHLRTTSPNGCYSLPMSPPIVQQIITSMNIIMNDDQGRIRIERLARNTRYFRHRLKQMGFIVYGSDASPVVPVMLYFPAKCGYWGREMLANKIGTVVVSYPATKLTKSRARFCISAAHHKEMLDYAIGAIVNILDTLNDMRIKLFNGNMISPRKLFETIKYKNVF